jgi:virulence-associated protein VagC
MSARGKVAKKLALYPPKELMLKLGMDEGKKVSYKVEDGRLVVEPIPDPIDLALRSKKWAKTSVRELELESEKEQRELYG